MGLISTAENLANRVVTWLTLFGFLSAGLAWLSSKLTPMKGFGWADFLAAGIGGAVAVTFAIAAILVGWRYFRPIPINIPPAQDSRPFLEVNSNKLPEEISRLSAQIAATEELSTGRFNKYSTEVLKAKEAVRNCSDELIGVNHNIDLLFKFAAAESTIKFCDVLIAEYPVFPGRLSGQPPDKIGQCAFQLENFIQTVRLKTHDTIYQKQVANILQNSEKVADNEISALPPDKRPVWLDPLQWRQYEILDMRTQALHGYFQQQRWEQLSYIVALQNDLVQAALKT